MVSRTTGNAMRGAGGDARRTLFESPERVPLPGWGLDPASNYDPSFAPAPVIRDERLHAGLRARE
jgi:hypothetical protein